MTIKVTSEMIKGIPLFHQLKESEINTIIQSSKVESYAKHKKIYQQDDEIKYLYVILKGCVKLGTSSNDDKYFVKYIVYQNEVFGENIFTNITRRLEDAEALSDCQILKVDEQIIKAMVGSNPDLLTAIANIIIKRIQEMEERMQSFVFLTAKERITGFLKKSIKIQGIKIGINEILINHGLSHKEIANITDTSRQTVAKILNELKDSNIIHFSDRKPGKILIRELAML